MDGTEDRRPRGARHFIEVQDLGREETLRLFELARLIKAADRDGVGLRLLEGASLAMIFEAPSTRTRLSFEVAMTQLGGHAMFLRPGELHFGAREAVEDTARVLGSMVDGVLARTLRHATIRDLAAAAEVPVINGMSDRCHPTQALCDVFTMLERRPAGKPVEALRVAFVGDATNVCGSLMELCTALGMHFVHAAPTRYQAPEAWRATAAANAARSGGGLTLTSDAVEAVRDADFVYTDAWCWGGREAEIPDRIAAFMPAFQVTAELLARAPAHARFMHRLPGARGEEATDGVMDGGRSLIRAQAENRLPVEKALLVTLLGSRARRATAEVAARHRAAIEGFLGA